MAWAGLGCPGGMAALGLGRYPLIRQNVLDEWNGRDLTLEEPCSERIDIDRRRSMLYALSSIESLAINTTCAIDRLLLPSS